MGIEPISLTWHTSVLPLNYTRTLHLGLAPKQIHRFKMTGISEMPVILADVFNHYSLVGVEGIEPPTTAPQTQDASATPHPEA